MKWDSCLREEEVRTTVREGRWPEACEPALRAHVVSCRRCSDFVLVTQTLQQGRLETAALAPLPSAGQLWYRAQLRRRTGDLQRVATPIALAEKLAALCLLAAGAGMAAWQSRTPDWLRWLSDVTQSDAFRLNALWSPASSSSGTLVVLIAALGAVALFGGLAVYLVQEKE